MIPDVVFLWETLLRLVAGLPLTLLLATLASLLGLLLAVGLAWARLRGPVWLAGAARLYVFAFRGTPLLVQIFLIYYGLTQFEALRQSPVWPMLREPFCCAVLALALNTAAYVAEILRGGLLAVPRGQVEAALACGMPQGRILRHIVAPIALRQALPAYGNEAALLVKATSLAATITLLDVSGLAVQLMTETYRVVEVLAVTGAIYLALNAALLGLLDRLDHALKIPPPPRPARRRAGGLPAARENPR